MTRRSVGTSRFVAAGVALYLAWCPLYACCPCPPLGKPIVNADQTVILIWDAANKTQHFIRKASFKGDADDFGFLIPSPTKPELAESGNHAFPFFEKLTEPEKRRRLRPIGGMPFGCGAGRGLGLGEAAPAVRVLDEKLVAGFNAVVLETDSAAALVAWLREQGYHYSPEIEAWAKPYVSRGWKITALKVAKDKGETAAKSVTTSALRMSFQTEMPLFPYREPDYGTTAEKLSTKDRLLRIYFVAEARYESEISKLNQWNGKVAWAGKLSAADRKKALELLQLPETTGPKVWHLTEFEDNWPYGLALGDVYFSRSSSQADVRRPPIVAQTGAPWTGDVMLIAIAALVIAPPLVSRARRWWS